MWVMASSFLRFFLDHTQRRTTFGRTPLDEWSARRRDLYLTTQNTHNRQTSMLPVGFESTISAGERPQTYALDRAATGTGSYSTLHGTKIITFVYEYTVFPSTRSSSMQYLSLTAPCRQISVHLFLTRAYRAARPSHAPWCGYRNGISWGTRIVKLLITAVFPSLPLRALACVRRNVYWHRNFVINCLTKLYGALLSARPCRHTAEWRYGAINS